MKTILNKKDLIILAKGASIFTTGGGVSLRDQIATINSLKDPKLRLVSLSELGKNLNIVTVGEVGPSDAPQIPKKNIITKMIVTFEKMTNKKISGIYAPEIGQESVVFESAHYGRLPIVDFDPVGFRAVPYLDVNIFNVKKLPYSFSPLIVTNLKNEIFVIEGRMESERVEDILRNLSIISPNGIIFFIGGMVRVASLLPEFKNVKSYSRALEYGALESIREIKKQLKPLKIIEGTVKKIVEKKKSGFLFYEVEFSDSDENIFYLTILNEAIFLKYRNKILYSIPKKILLIDPISLCGIPSGGLRKGVRVIVAVVEPNPEWSNPEGERVFGKKRFKDLV